MCFLCRNSFFSSWSVISVKLKVKFSGVTCGMWNKYCQDKEQVQVEDGMAISLNKLREQIASY